MILHTHHYIRYIGATGRITYRCKSCGHEVDWNYARDAYEQERSQSNVKNNEAIRPNGCRVQCYQVGVATPHR